MGDMDAELDAAGQFSDLTDRDGITVNALKSLWQLGIVEAQWDAEAAENRWHLSEFGVALAERDLVEAYIRREKMREQIESRVGSEQPAAIRNLQGGGSR